MDSARRAGLNAMLAPVAGVGGKCILPHLLHGPRPLRTPTATCRSFPPPACPRSTRHHRRVEARATVVAETLLVAAVRLLPGSASAASPRQQVRVGFARVLGRGQARQGRGQGALHASTCARDAACPGQNDETKARQLLERAEHVCLISNSLVGQAASSRPSSSVEASVGEPLILLASASPRRANCCARSAFRTQCGRWSVDESVVRNEAPAAYVLRLAEAKRRAVAALAPESAGGCWRPTRRWRSKARSSASLGSSRRPARCSAISRAEPTWCTQRSRCYTQGPLPASAAAP